MIIPRIGLRIRIVMIALGLVPTVSAVGVFQAAYTPKTGSLERKAIMDALRGPVEEDLRKRVIFKVDHLKVQGSWAFMRGIPKLPDGRPMDYTGTRYARLKKEGVFDDWICALFKKKADKWTVVTFVIGATDVPYEGWREEYKAPPSIFD